MQVFTPSNTNGMALQLAEVLGIIVVLGIAFSYLYRLLFRWLPDTIYDLGLRLVLALGVLIGLYLGARFILSR